MLLLFGIIKKIFKIHTQERKVATYTSTSLKSRFCLFVTMAHGINCTQLLGKAKLRMAKKAYQDGHTQVRMTLNRARGHLHKLALCGESLPTVPKLSWAKLFLLRIEKNTHRGTYFTRDRESHHSIPLLLPSQLAGPSLPQQHHGRPRPRHVCRLCGSGLAGSSTLYLGLLYWRAIHFHRMGRKSLRLQRRKRKKPWLVTILRARFHSFDTAQTLAICTKHRSSYGLFLNSMILVYYAHWYSIVPENPVKMWTPDGQGLCLAYHYSSTMPGT